MDQTIKLSVGLLDVITSGVVVSNGYDPVDIHIVANYRVRLAFEAAPLEPPVTFRAVTAPGITTVKLINFDQGGASIYPLHVANWLGKKVLLSLGTSVWGQPPAIARQTAYTLLWGGPQ